MNKNTFHGGQYMKLLSDPTPFCLLIELRHIVGHGQVLLLELLFDQGHLANLDDDYVAHDRIPIVRGHPAQ